jgi:hypothetical protein
LFLAIRLCKTPDVIVGDEPSLALAESVNPAFASVATHHCWRFTAAGHTRLATHRFSIVNNAVS